jgi:hypothetical protein
LSYSTAFDENEDDEDDDCDEDEDEDEDVIDGWTTVKSVVNISCSLYLLG